MQAILSRLSAERDLQRLYGAAVTEAAAFFGVAQCAILLHDAQSGQMQVQPPAIGLDMTRIQADASTRENGTSQVDEWPPHGVLPLKGLGCAPHGTDDPGEDGQASQGLVALICRERQPVGELRVAGRVDDTPFTEVEIHLLGFYASQLGTLIHNVQLQEREQRERRLAETLLNVPKAVRPPSSSTFDTGRGQEADSPGKSDLRSVLVRLLGLLADVIDCSGATISLVEGSRLRLIAGLAPTTFSEGRSSASDSDPRLGRMLKAGRAIVVRDTTQDPGWPGFGRSESVKSWLGAPIWMPGSSRLRRADLIGTLDIDSERLDAFTQADETVAQAFADQIAIALESQRLQADMTRLRQARRRSKDLVLLNQVTTAINSAMNLSDLLYLLLSQLKRLVHFDRASVTLLEGDEFVIVGAAGFQPGANAIGRRYPVDRFPLNQAVIAAGKPISIADVLADPRWIVSEGNLTVRGWMGVPLAYRGRATGLLTLTATEPSYHSHQEEQLVAAIAEHAALTIEKVRLLDELQRHLETSEGRSRDLALLNRVSGRLSSSLDLNEVLNNAVTEIATALSVQQVGLVRYDWTKGYGQVVAEYQQHPNNTGEDALIPVAGNPSLARVLETRAPLAIHDAQHDPLLASVRDVMVKRGVKSILILPLIVRGEVTGTIGVDELRHLREFAPAEIELAQTITNQAAAAVANAGLYEDVKRRAVQLQTIQEVTTRISTILDPEELLMQVADLLADRCGYHQVYAFVVDSSGENLVALGGSGEMGRRVVADRLSLRIGDTSLCGRAAATGEIAIVDDAATNPGFVPCAYSPEALSEIAVPMKLGGRVTGLLDVQSASVNAFDDADRFLIETLADQAAIALENARLYETIQERAQQLTAAYEDLKALDRMKDEFVQTVSHELRTPLTFIKGYVELMLEGILGGLNAEQKEAMQIVAQRTESIVRLVSDIISLTRGDSMGLRFEQVDMGDVALASIQSAQAVTEQAGIRLRAEIPPAMPAVTGDTQRLGQVFDNLIGNAIKFSPNGGEICVRLHFDEAVVRAEVIDHGIGISPDHLQRVWERFYQVDGTTTRRFGGTGLGLAIVKLLVEAHGGEVTVASVHGKGSTFSFTIPRADAPQGAPPVA